MQIHAQATEGRPDDVNRRKRGRLFSNEVSQPAGSSGAGEPDGSSRTTTMPSACHAWGLSRGRRPSCPERTRGPASACRPRQLCCQLSGATAVTAEGRAGPKYAVISCCREARGTTNWAGLVRTEAVDILALDRAALPELIHLRDLGDSRKFLGLFVAYSQTGVGQSPSPTLHFVQSCLIEASMTNDTGFAPSATSEASDDLWRQWAHQARRREQVRGLIWRQWRSAARPALRPGDVRLGMDAWSWRQRTTHFARWSRKLRSGLVRGTAAVAVGWAIVVLVVTARGFLIDSPDLLDRAANNSGTSSVL